MCIRDSLRVGRLLMRLAFGLHRLPGNAQPSLGVRPRGGRPCVCLRGLVGRAVVGAFVDCRRCGTRL
eukprot:10407150-Lingulodinium_polyedra.AAC.1